MAFAKQIILFYTFLLSRIEIFVFSDKKLSIFLNSYLSQDGFMKTLLDLLKKISPINRIDTPFVKISKNSFSKTPFCKPYIYEGALFFFSNNIK